MIVEYEASAALYRQLSERHRDSLHPILGYGAEGKVLAIAQEASPRGCGLRGLRFTPQRCHRILGHSLKALAHLHSQIMPHGHLSPESILVEEGPLGPKAYLVWAPGQRRGQASATLGFRSPDRARGLGPPTPRCLAADVWALACVVLVWWMGFDPVPHPWTQFARSQRLQHDILDALAEQPPALPGALLDLHAAAAKAEEPGHTFLTHLAGLLTECFCTEPEQRPTVEQLLCHRFFELAL